MNTILWTGSPSLIICYKVEAMFRNTGKLHCQIGIDYNVELFEFWNLFVFREDEVLNPVTEVIENEIIQVVEQRDLERSNDQDFQEDDHNHERCRVDLSVGN